MAGKNVLIIGSGAREHSIAWKLDESRLVNKVFVAPGNICKYSVATNQSFKTVDEVRLFCQQNSISLVVIGPEKEICDGWADELADFCHVFAPSQKCAKLEASKAFAKNFMIENNLPTAEFYTFDAAEPAIQFVTTVKWKKIVIKEDGLCAGKGVSIAESRSEALAKINKIFQADNKCIIVLEEFLEGYEVSALCFTDGKTIRRLPLSQDHKRAFDGDQGAMTGGMGAISPLVLPKETDEKITQILQNTIDALCRKGTPYKGVLYAGLMITQNGPKLLEFNCRFGDPETEVVLRLLDSDLFEIMRACCAGNLDELSINWSKKHAIGIVMASAGYPQSFTKGLSVSDLPIDLDGIVTFFAGLKRSQDNILINSGGRVLCVTCVDVSPFTAKLKCMKALESINFSGKQFRRDIGNFVLLPPREDLSYSASGVNVDEGNKFVEGIKEFCRLTLSAGTEQIGGFGALIDLKVAGFSQPQLVIGMDGVGTKLEIASLTANYDSLGYDLVGMCVNDVLCHGAKPIAFLDYYVTGKLDRLQATKIVKSISEACVTAECALVGGETAEMPGVYGANQWDIAGCCIGVREESWPKLPVFEKIKPGDILVGLASNGVHSNGLSLVRKIIAFNGTSLQDKCPWDNNFLIGDELLRPTKIYVKTLLDLAKSGRINAMAHITGGGIIENLPRCLPKNLAAIVDCQKWQPLPVFNWLKAAGSISSVEMLKTFNCGIGMILVVAPDAIVNVRQSLNESSTKFYEIGTLVDNQHNAERVRFKHIENLFAPSNDTIVTNLNRINVAILISGTGSNMVELIYQSRKRNSSCYVSIVISNNPVAKGLEVARLLGVETLVIESRKKTREDFEAEVAKELLERNVELICLAGFMRLLTTKFISQWTNQIINVHPSLLPSFKGAHAVPLALEAGVKITGCTVHYVVEDVDAGQILAQEAVLVEPTDTESTLHSKIQAKEYLLFPQVMERIANKILKKNC